MIWLCLLNVEHWMNESSFFVYCILLSLNCFGCINPLIYHSIVRRASFANNFWNGFELKVECFVAFMTYCFPNILFSSINFHSIQFHRYTHISNYFAHSRTKRAIHKWINFNKFFLCWFFFTFHIRSETKKDQFRTTCLYQINFSSNGVLNINTILWFLFFFSFWVLAFFSGSQNIRFVRCV